MIAQHFTWHSFTEPRDEDPLWVDEQMDSAWGDWATASPQPAGGPSDLSPLRGLRRAGAHRAQGCGR